MVSKKDMLEFTVTGIGIDTRTNNPLVILHSISEEDLILPIWIGRLEAQSIAIALQGEKLERPLTHDLMANSIESLGYQIDRAEIHSVQNGTFFANLFLKNKMSGEEISVDARPSDCISLALRGNASIFVSNSVVEQSCIPAIIHTEEDEVEEEKREKEEFRKFLDNVNASDFKLPPEDFDWHKS